MKFRIKGHENVLATHNSTLEFTKDMYLTKKGDCIIGVDSDFDYNELMKIVKKEKIVITITIDDQKEIINAKVNKNFNHKHEIVIRKTSFLSDRTLGIYADKAAIDVDRNIIEKLKNPDAKAVVEIK